MKMFLPTTAGVFGITYDLTGQLEVALASMCIVEAADESFRTGRAIDF
jgi:hypothetical protein